MKYLVEDIPRKERARHLVTCYATEDKSMLGNSISRISKRLGGLNTRKALAHLAANDFFEVVMITLQYYDKYYLRGLKNRKHEDIFPLELSKIDFRENAKQILAYHEQIGQKKDKAHSV